MKVLILGTFHGCFPRILAVTTCITAVRAAQTPNKPQRRGRKQEVAGGTGKPLKPKALKL